MSDHFGYQQQPPTSQPGYPPAPPPGYAVQPGYAPQPDFSQQQAGYSPQPDYAQQQAYAAQHQAYAQQPQYPQQAQYTQQLPGQAQQSYRPTAPIPVTYAPIFGYAMLGAVALTTIAYLAQALVDGGDGGAARTIAELTGFANIVSALLLGLGLVAVVSGPRTPAARSVLFLLAGSAGAFVPIAFVQICAALAADNYQRTTTFFAGGGTIATLGAIAAFAFLETKRPVSA